MISIKGVDTVQKIQCSNFNAKESTTYIGTISKDPNLKIPLCIIASGKTSVSERKYKIANSNDYCLHSSNGWTTASTMVSYLKWLSNKMEKKPFVLLLDVYRAHKDPKVIREAKKLNIKLIYIPSGGTGLYQPLDRKIFGIVKAKLKSKNILSGDPKKRHQEIHKAMNQIWSEISNETINSAWNIPEMNKYTYADPDDKNDMDYNPQKQ